MNDIWEHHFKFYDLFQSNFDRYRNTIQLHVDVLRNAKNILDTGTGSGNLTLELLKQNHNITAIDTNEYALKLLKKKCTSFSTLKDVHIMNVENLKFEHDTFNAVSSMFVVPFVKDNNKYFSEVYRVLKNDGIFTLSAWSPLTDSLTTILSWLKKDLENKNLLPKYQEQLDYIMQTSEKAAKKVTQGPHDAELHKLLINAGFTEVHLHDNPYKEYAYFFTAKK